MAVELIPSRRRFWQIIRTEQLTKLGPKHTLATSLAIRVAISTKYGCYRIARSLLFIMLNSRRTKYLIPKTNPSMNTIYRSIEKTLIK